MEVKAATLAYRNKNKFMVPDEIRELASVAAQCRVLRRKAQKARREFDARVGALPRGNVVKKPVSDEALGQRQGHRGQGRVVRGGTFTLRRML